MAKTSTTNLTSTTDAYIGQQIDESPSGLSAAEKVAIGFAIAGGAIILGYILYHGISYIISYTGFGYRAVPNPNGRNIGMQQLPTNQYSQFITPTPAVYQHQQQPISPVPTQPYAQPAPVPNTQNVDWDKALVNVFKALSDVTQNNNSVQANMEQLNNNQAAMTSTMNEMAKGVNIRNTQEFENMQNENAYLKQRLNNLMAEKERSDAFANLMMGKHDELARQTGAPLGQEYLNALNSAPTGTTKYPNLNPNAPTDGITR